MSPELQPWPGTYQTPPLGSNATHRHIIPHHRSTSSCEIIDLDDLDDEVVEIQRIDSDRSEVIDIEELESELEKDIFEVTVPGEHEEMPLKESPKRNAPLTAPLRKMDMVMCQHGRRIQLRPGETVELKDGRFLEIKTIVENAWTKSVVLRGWELKRTKDLDGELIFKLNEVCYIFDKDLDDPRPMHEQCIIEASFMDIKKVRRLTRTNYLFPSHRFDLSQLPPGDKNMKRKHAEEEEGLVVRWQYITTFKTAKDRERQPQTSSSYTSRKLVRLGKKECDDNCHVSPFALRYDWRGDVTLEQAFISRGSEEDVVIIDHGIRTSSNSIENAICLDDSDDEISSCPKGKSPNTPEDTGVLIHISSHDFDTLDPMTFSQTIRRRFDTKVKLKREGEKNSRDETRAQFKKKRKGVNDTNPKTIGNNAAKDAQTKVCNPATQKLNTQSTTTAHKYRYADAFCGAGGATCGAVMAGLKVVWGLDFNPNAAETWRYNFPQAEMYEMWADELCRLPDPEGKLIVDVLHLSPPCQVWSPAHTVAGKDDDMNFASLYAVQELIAKAKPRFVTLEQTFGIIHQRFKNPFNNLIRMFTHHNFSISWQIMELERLGLPQRRKRLIIVAAAPGETLPPLPEYTHSRHEGNGLQKFRTAERELASIPRNAANHDIPNNPQGNYVPWDPSTILPNCITTAGANGRGYPDGSRGLSCREIASLQTFPLHHVFRGMGIRKQIGNAVPPLIGKLLFSSVREHMENLDSEARGGLE